MSLLPKFALLMFAGTLSCALGAGAAGAATADDAAPSLVIRYRAESLANDNGVRDLYRRIIIAARRVCPDDDVRDLHTHGLVQACRAQAVSRAIQHIDNSRLAALHASSMKNG
jgi:UrcA family protein